MKTLGDDDEVLLTEDALGANDGVESAQARIVTVYVIGRHAFLDEGILHVGGFVVAVAMVVTADQQELDFASVIKLGGGLHTGVKKGVVIGTDFSRASEDKTKLLLRDFIDAGVATTVRHPDHRKVNCGNNHRRNRSHHGDSLPPVAEKPRDAALILRVVLTHGLGCRRMRAVVQRVSEAAVFIAGDEVARIDRGLLVLVGIEEADHAEDVEWLAGKVARLRIFSDAEGKMNASLAETGGRLLVVSQFTLHASTKKGNRPSFIRAARPEVAIPLYESFLAKLEEDVGEPVARGAFGADMQISLVNDGPVTVWFDTKARE